MEEEGEGANSFYQNEDENGRHRDRIEDEEDHSGWSLLFSCFFLAFICRSLSIVLSNPAFALP